MQTAESLEKIRRVWQEIDGTGNLRPLEALLVEDARWRVLWMQAGGCAGRRQIIRTIGRSLRAGRLRGSLETLQACGEHVVAGFRPAPGVMPADVQSPHSPTQPEQFSRPLDDGLAYVLLKMRGEQIAELVGCADRAQAVSLACAAE